MNPRPAPALRTILAVGVAAILFGAYTLARPRFAGSAAGSTSPAPPPSAAATEAAPAIEAAAASSPALGGERLGRVPAERAPQRILLFGDSMVPVLASRFADYALENGHTLFPVVWYGSTIIHWAKIDEIDQLLVELQPTLVVAVLGSSELSVREVGECEPFVRLIASKVGPRKLVWIGPPNWRDDTGVNAMIERAIGADRFFRSSALALDRRADGIHPTTEGGAAWVDAFARWAETESRAPILLAPPTRAAPKIPARVISRRR